MQSITDLRLVTVLRLKEGPHNKPWRDVKPELCYSSDNQTLDHAYRKQAYSEKVRGGLQFCRCKHIH